MSVHRCPDCSYRGWVQECATCRGSRYVHRNDHGRITHPATPKEYLDAVVVKKPGLRPGPQGFIDRKRLP